MISARRVTYALLARPMLLVKSREDSQFDDAVYHSSLTDSLILADTCPFYEPAFDVAAP